MVEELKDEGATGKAEIGKAESRNRKAEKWDHGGKAETLKVES
jgi:hypothetical protein